MDITMYMEILYDGLFKWYTFHYDGLEAGEKKQTVSKERAEEEL